MPKIFISYRRDDAAYPAQSIHEKLAAHFGEADVFFDIDNIPFGLDFHEYLNDAVSQCDLLVAVIGDQWLHCRDDSGGRRLDNPNDFVRIEIEAALSRKIPVVPVLVGKASMPLAKDLPETLSHLTRRHAAEVRPGRDFHSHLERLVRGIEHSLNEALRRASSDQNRSTHEKPSVERTPIPSWAIDYGEDEFGTYSEFEVPVAGAAAARQRLRWIPPGQFQMGSPESEPGRFDREILHSVTISSGFWMFDTPCTQRLWQAIISGQNPSRFPDPDRPVEQVNWDQSLEFAENLSKRIGMKFTLPTEAQWEYACRAGTSTAIYSGPLEILGDANAPALDPIAWYAGNCGHEYDLKNKGPVTWTEQKQYQFEKGGTRRVKQKKPNPWGLYDMLGNVWEWCDDWLGEYSSQSQVDPTGPTEGSARVVRGGSWIDVARFSRSACRGRDHSGFRANDLGFRLLSSASSVQSFAAASNK